MKNWKKNLITAAILVTVCSGIYLNWVYTGGDDTKNLEDTLDAEKVMSDDLLYLGDESVEVGGDENTITDYFAAVRLSRQEARDKAVSLLQEAMSYGDQQQIEASNEQLEEIIQTALCEAQIESLIVAKGYRDCVAYMTEEGISVAVGMAIAAKYQGKTNRVYALLGDGEIQEGQVWEACMAASHYKLDNLCIVVDNNGLQIDGAVKDVMSPYPIVGKLEAFGFKVEAVDGHDFDALEKAFANARETKGAPYAIVMTTTKGKGVSYMENQAGWHGKAPNDAEYEQAMSELKAQMAELEG